MKKNTSKNIKFFYAKLLILQFLFAFSKLHAEENQTPPFVLDVKQAEKIGIENSPALKQTENQQAIKKLLVNENWRNYFPTASIRWDRNTNMIGNSDDSRNQRASLNLDQVVYDGGRRSLALTAALSDLALAKYDLRLALNDLRFKIRSAFYNLLAKKAQLDVIKLSKKRQEQQLFFAKAEVRLGETIEVQALEIENRLSEIIVQEKNAIIAYNNQLGDFKILLRLPNSTRLELKGDILNSVNYKFENLSEDELIEYAFKFRVDFDKAKAAEMQAVAQADYAQTYYIPTISIGSFYGYRGDTYPPRQPEYGFNFKLSMSLFGSTVTDTSNYTSRNDNTDRSMSSSTSVQILDNLQYKRQIITTSNAALQARLNRAQLNDIIKNEVIKVKAKYQVSWDSLLQTDSNIKVFDKRMEIMIKRVEKGEARRTELAENEVRYLEAKTAQINARVSYMTSIAEMEIATGLTLDDLKLLDIQ